MKIVFEIVSAGAASMAIIDGEEATLRPRGRVLRFRPGHVENDRHPILVVVPLNSLMRVGRVAGDQPMRL